jgi:hypothetical protein
MLEKHPDIVFKTLEIINYKTSNFKEIPNIDSVLANKYNQKLEDIQEWLSLTKWSQKQLSEVELNSIQDQLVALKIISKKAAFSEITN